MVTKLPMPQTCSLALVDQVVQERANGVNRAWFNSLANEWRQRVRAYIAAGGNPEVVSTWDAIIANGGRFINLYNKPHRTSVQGPILAALRDRKMQYCPSCGEEGTPNTLDHYLPKGAYPHFAITPVNLTPMCDICQQVKGVQVLDDQGRRIYLHPYYDDFLASQVLRLTIGRPFEAPQEFTLEPDPDLPEDLIALTQRHIDGLDLVRRYSHFFSENYIRLLKLAHQARSTGQDVHLLIEAFKVHHRTRSANVWPHIFYAGVAEDLNLLEYLSSGVLPSQL
jgi:hypothetical protein